MRVGDVVRNRVTGSEAVITGITTHNGKAYLSLDYGAGMWSTCEEASDFEFVRSSKLGERETLRRGGEITGTPDPVAEEDHHVEHRLRTAYQAGEKKARFFAFAHLPNLELRAVSRMFAGLAVELLDKVPAGPERTIALNKLVEAKEAAVRAALPPWD